MSACPTGAGSPRLRFRPFCPKEILRPAMGAVEDGVPEPHHGPPPLAFAHPAVERIVEAVGKRLREEILQKGGIDRPVLDRIVVEARHRAVARSARS